MILTAKSVKHAKITPVFSTGGTEECALGLIALGGLRALGG
jgi:hypothetical protein